MSFSKIEIGNNLKEYDFLNFGLEFEIKGYLIWDAANPKKLNKIKFIVKNNRYQSYSYRYLKSESNICLNVIPGNDSHLLEINFLREILTNNYQVSDEIDVSNKNIIFKQGTILFNNKIIYSLKPDGTYKVEDCKFSGFNGQPQTKNGNILVGG